MKRSLSVVVAMVLSACAHQEQPAVSPPLKPSEIDRQIATAVADAAESLRRLSLVEQARTPPADIEIDSVPRELTQPQTLDYVGPVEPVLRTLAGLVGYDFVTVGDPPAQDLVVDVIAVDRPAYRILQDVGLQLGSRATVSLTPAGHGRRGVVALHYEA